MWNYCYTKFDPQIICKTQFVSFSPESVHQVTKAWWQRLTFPAILDIYIALYLTATWHTPEAPLLALECSLLHDRTLKYQTDTGVLIPYYHLSCARAAKSQKSVFGKSEKRSGSHSATEKWSLSASRDWSILLLIYAKRSCLNTLR